ncbi:MAG: hypothetical protein KBG15_08335 [Kofleriaceae bacterium]|nr:hypothetical protein [Kofleriaceae bacterium]
MRTLSSLFAACLTALTLTASVAYAAPRLDRDFTRMELEILPDPEAEALDPVAVRNALAAARQANLAAFHTYRTAGVYPHNTYAPGKLNVWTDDEGHICAAATIIKMSGDAELVTQTARSNNFVRLMDVKDGALMNWILTSGLTQREIATIQEPFMEVPDPVSIRAEQRAAARVAAARKREDARLAKKYAAIEAMIAANSQASLDIATATILKQPALARALLNRGGALPRVSADRAPDTATAPRFAQPPPAV